MQISKLSHHVGPKLLACLATLLASCSGTQDPFEMFHSGDYESAFEIFSERAKNGDVAASNYVGLHYYLGAGVSRDFEQAVEWFKVAALAEDPDAQRNLGVMYLNGYGVEQDYHQAHGWMYFAHAGGSESAKGYLDLMSDNVTPNASGVARRNVQAQIDVWAKQQKALSSNDASP